MAMHFAAIFFFLGMVLEFSTLFWVGSWLGFGLTFLLLLAGMVAGSALLRNHLAVAKVMMAGQFLRGGGLSFYEMLFPIRLPLAGLLLFLPTGFLSSVCGLLLLLPFSGKPIAGATQSQQSQDYFEQNGFQYTKQSHVYQHDDDVIEGEYTVKSSSQKQR